MDVTYNALLRTWVSYTANTMDNVIAYVNFSNSMSQQTSS